MSHVHRPTRAGWLRAIRYFALAAIVLVGARPADATLLSSVQASDGIDTKILSQPNIGRSVAVAPDGTIYVAYVSGDQLQLRMARSIDRGASFQPSVAAVTSGGPAIVNINIAVASNGFVYAVAVANDSSVTLGRSFDGGQTFASLALGTAATASEIGLATDGNHVYVAVPNVLSSSDWGVTFPTSTSAPFGAAYWHLNVDPGNGNVVFSGDTPSLFVSVSTDHGATFGATQNPAGTDFYSSTTISSGPLGSYLFVGCSPIATCGGVRINLGDFSSTALPNLPLTNTSAVQSQSLAADSGGNVVAGYVNGSNNAAFEVSNDLGANFGPEVAVTGASQETVEINSAYGDVLFAYKLGGQVYIDTHCGLIGVACAQVSLAVTDGNAYARYGQLVTYLVTATNPTNAAVSGVPVSGTFSPALNGAAASWTCVSGAGPQCPNGSGTYGSSVDIGAHQSLSWLVSVPVIASSTDADAEFDVSAPGAATAQDIDTLVLFRDGFNVINGNGTNSVIPAPGAAAILAGSTNKTITLPRSSGALVDNVLTLPYSGGELRLQHATAGRAEFARLLDHPVSGQERASAWVSVESGANLTISGDSAGLAVVHGGSQPISLQLTY